MSLTAFCAHRVCPHHPVRSDWHPVTPWELVDGRYQRLFKSRSNRGHLRRAMIYRSAGGWRWRVSQANSAGTASVIGDSAADIIYTLAYNAFNPAEVSATTK
jgi:hypothetical protein